ncbi:MAG: cysteine protease StiP family protein [Deltaproteobacteria bacterium]|nr:cysteine protease StiP family protein [Deltaproteobacteria bacterium]
MGGDFHGSYAPEDVTFLLKVVELAPLGIEERELRVQSGESHYSEMIGPEAPPDPDYLSFFAEALERNLGRLASDLVKTASLIALLRPGPVTLVSIARSGTPVGVVLGRLLRALFARDCVHFSISVVRDRGADLNALRRVASLRPPESVVFVDGWTGKGVIARELRRSLAGPGAALGAAFPRELAVLSDLCGEAELSAGSDDWLIPTCLLNGTVSGLVSRTILNRDLTGPGDFHGCLYYGGLEPHDLSRPLADRMTAAAAAAARRDPRLLAWCEFPREAERARAREGSRAFLDSVRRRYGISDPNHVKPGLGEATRALLRRSPGLLAVRDPGDPDVRHAILLAGRRGVPVEVDTALAYRAVALIRRVLPEAARRPAGGEAA